MSFSTRTMTAQDWVDLAQEFGQAYFGPDEFKYPDKMGYEFIRWLFEVRVEAGVRMNVTSDHRPKAYNTTVGGAEDSAHVDVPCSSADFGNKGKNKMTNIDRFHIIRAAMKLGCVRIGFYKNGSIHLDRTEDRRPAPRLWTVVK